MTQMAFGNFRIFSEIGILSRCSYKLQNKIIYLLFNLVVIERFAHKKILQVHLNQILILSDKKNIENNIFFFFSDVHSAQ